MGGAKYHTTALKWKGARPSDKGRTVYSASMGLSVTKLACKVIQIHGVTYKCYNVCYCTHPVMPSKCPVTLTVCLVLFKLQPPPRFQILSIVVSLLTYTSLASLFKT